MEWWAWIAVGAILLGSELAFVNAQFYLVFVGASRTGRGIFGSVGVAAGRLAAVAVVRASWPLFPWLHFAGGSTSACAANCPR